MKAQRYIISVVVLVLIVTLSTVFFLDVPNRIHLIARENSILTSNASSISFIIRNNSFRSILYGEFFQVEKWNDGNKTWGYYNDKPDEPFRDGLGLLQINPLCKKERVYNLRQYSDVYENGRYRIVQVIELFNSNSARETNREFKVYGEFEIVTNLNR